MYSASFISLLTLASVNLSVADDSAHALSSLFDRMLKQGSLPLADLDTTLGEPNKKRKPGHPVKGRTEPDIAPVHEGFAPVPAPVQYKHESKEEHKHEPEVQPAWSASPAPAPVQYTAPPAPAPRQPAGKIYPHLPPTPDYAKPLLGAYLLGVGALLADTCRRGV
eukprot:gnl/TRDRNA2_/TRDRNA2_90376_c0_seq1.p1 gnl/TRDRNA2_/TRDRNA2_90376_c0~~gnl/TRDRNA2_/TRDRNA2_90376_c0_seq1.p1  ORF type:complete len:165 (-),score=9.36 gnl/TRDRNA2_/TRDRNA2_90376_c0_seq1:278-772(-)